MRVQHIFLLIVIWETCNGYFEQKLIRRAMEYDPNLSAIEIESIKFPKCPKELMDLEHNATYVTQLCLTKDLFYNIEVIIGEDQAMEFSLDLTQPWTWFKSKNCQRCKIFDPTDFDNDKSCKTKKESCTNKLFDATYDSKDWQDSKIKGKIYSDEELVMGQFQKDSLSFMAYNSSRKMSLAEYIEEKLGKDEELDTIEIKNLKMLSVTRMYGAHNYLADGALGLGFGYPETDEEQSQPDTDFLEALIKQDTPLKLTRQRLAIYCLETGPYFPDYVVQFGGFDYKYAHQHSQEIIWLPRIKSSGYYWMVQLDKIRFFQISHSDDNQAIEIAKKKAIFTFSSQFIELPKQELLDFLKIMNSYSSETQCSLVDQEDLMVYCKKLIFPLHFIDLKLYFNFNGKDIELSSHLIYRNCTQHQDFANYQDCLLNVRYSKSEYVILGEPFLKWHYTIFDNEPGNNELQQIGILPAATNMYYQEHPEPLFNPENWYLYKVVLYIFVVGLITICCIANFKRTCKDIYRAWKYRKNVSLEDQKKLRVKQMDDELNNEMESDLAEKQIQMANKDKEEWEKSNSQFNFSTKFEQSFHEGFKGIPSIEDSSI